MRYLVPSDQELYGKAAELLIGKVVQSTSLDCTENRWLFPVYLPLLMEEFPNNHLGCIKPVVNNKICTISTLCRISSINRMSNSLVLFLSILFFRSSLPDHHGFQKIFRLIKRKLITKL